jgi:flagellar protein FliL
MSEEKKEAAAADGAPAKADTKPNKMMPLLVGVNSLLLLGVLGFMGFSMMHKAPAAHDKGEEAAEEEKPEKKEEGHAEKKEEGHGEKKEEGHGEKKEEGHGEKKDGEHGAVAGGPGPMVKLPDFVIHLRNPELDRYARMSFDVEVIGDSDKDRLNANLPRVRDAFISYLSDRTLEELRGSEGLGRTKDALQQRLRELIPEARIRALYISDFVVQ